jgi:hypothetical protein
VRNNEKENKIFLENKKNKYLRYSKKKISKVKYQILDYISEIKKGLNGLANNSISSLAMSNQMIIKNH